MQHLGAPEDLLGNARQQSLLQCDNPSRVLPGLGLSMAMGWGKSPGVNTSGSFNLLYLTTYAPETWAVPGSCSTALP